MSFFAAFAGFAALIILHELGHFLAAKAVGMRVERFALFFPPLIAKFRRGETEYGIGAIPLGGYVRITGMNPNEEIPPEVAHRAYYRQPVWKRIFVISAGPAMNVLVAFVILWGLFLANGTFEPTSTIASVEQGQPASGVLMAGDRVVSVDGRSGEQAELSRQIASHRCAGKQVDGCRASTPVMLIVERNGRTQRLEVTPRFDTGVSPARTRLGFAFDVLERDAGPLRSASLSVEGIWNVTTATVRAIVRVVTPQGREEISGVVGTYEVTRQTIDRYGLSDVLQILAIVSLSLAIVNLFPFLPLDGGHIFWALAEKVRGRAIPFSVMERAGLVGFLLVIALFMIGLTNDIDRLRGEGFGLR